MPVMDAVLKVAVLEHAPRIGPRLADVDGVAVMASVRQADAVLVVDALPALDAVRATRRLVLEADAPCVVVSACATRLLLAAAAGARGGLLDTTTLATVEDALRTVAAGQAVVAPELLADLAAAEAERRSSAHCARRRFEDASARELEVAQLVAQGLTNAAIGRELFLAEATVKTYVTRTLRKLRVHTRTELAALVHAAELDGERPPAAVLQAATR
jgi:DNA-binding NarL/FixJ family response regulator